MAFTCRAAISTDLCGSEPARESAVSGNDDVECAAAFAQARSHRDFGCSGDGRSTPYQCGSEPAREIAVSGNDDVGCATAFASRLAPTGILVAMKMVDLPRISVEASSLAKAQCQAMTMLNVPPPSRAGSLPQGFWLLWRWSICHVAVWERACSRKRSVRQ